MAGKESTYKVKLDLDEAIKKLEEATSSLNKFSRAMNEFRNAQHPEKYVQDLAQSLHGFTTISDKASGAAYNYVQAMNELSVSFENLTKVQRAFSTTVGAASSFSEVGEGIKHLREANAEMRRLQTDVRKVEIRSNVISLAQKSLYGTPAYRTLDQLSADLSAGETKEAEFAERLKSQVELRDMYRKARSLNKDPAMQEKYSKQIDNLTAAIGVTIQKLPSFVDAINQQTEAYKKEIADAEKSRAESRATTMTDKMRRGQKAFGVNDFFDTQIEDYRSKAGIAKRRLDRYDELSKKTNLSDPEMAELEGLNQMKGTLESDLASSNAKISSLSSWQMALNTTINTFKSIANAARKAAGYFKEITGISISIKDNFRAIISEMGAMANSKTGMATFGQGSSLVTNQAARNLQLKYGLSSASTYGLSEAMSMFNIQSDTDIAYMNPRQQAAFTNYMQRASDWYSQMEQSGVLENVQEMQLDLAMYRKEIAVDFLKWMGENKDTILGVATGMLNITKMIFNTLTRLLNVPTSSLYGSVTGADKVKSIQVNVTSNVKVDSAGAGASDVATTFENTILNTINKIGER